MSDHVLSVHVKARSIINRQSLVHAAVPVPINLDFGPYASDHASGSIDSVSSDCHAKRAASTADVQPILQAHKNRALNLINNGQLQKRPSWSRWRVLICAADGNRNLAL